MAKKNNKSKKTNKKKSKDIGEPRKKGMQPSEAIGAFERAFRRAKADEVEDELREDLNVKVIVAESREAFEKRFLEEGMWPRMITVAYWVFRTKAEEYEDIYQVDLTAFKSRAERHPDKELGALFIEEALSRCNHSDITPEKTYLLLSSEAGYSENEGLTFNGKGSETGWMEPKNRGEERQNKGGKHQTFKEHSSGIYSRVNELSKLYEPFIKKWIANLFPDTDITVQDFITQNLLKAIKVSALFHDVGKLSGKWQEKIGWKEGEEFIARTAEKNKQIKLPPHAPFAYIFLRTLLRRFFDIGEDDWGQVLDFIALSSARHHSIGVMGNVEEGFEPVAGAEATLEELGELEGVKIWIQESLEAMKKGSKAIDAPAPSDDFYFIYCLAHRLIKVADWEDAGGEAIELAELRGWKD